MISHDIDGDAERDPQEELCNAVSSDNQTDHGRCYGEREEIGRQERNVDVLREPEGSRNGAQERLPGMGVRLTVNIVMFQQNISSYHILLPRSYVRLRDCIRGSISLFPPLSVLSRSQPRSREAEVVPLDQAGKQGKLEFIENIVEPRMG